MPVDRVAYNESEAAEAIGVSRETILRLIGQGYLKVWKCGRQRRILRKDLEALLETDIPSLYQDRMQPKPNEESTP